MDFEKVWKKLHQMLWDGFGLSPEQAMKHLNILLLLKLIEPKIDDGTFKLPEICKFSQLLGKGGAETASKFKEALKEITQHNDLRSFFQGFTIKHPDRLFDIIQELISIDMKNDKDHVGDLYEYIIGRGASTMSDAGQYFTNRSICSYIIELINPKLNENGNVPSMIDPFMGTGGFLVSFVKHFKDVDWEKQKVKVFGVDKFENAFSGTHANLLCHTGIPFSSENIVMKNSFTDDLPGKKFSYIISNPPYGGDKGSFKYEECSKAIQKVGIEDNTKVSAAVQLCCSKLAKKGTCALVLPDGFFFGSSKKQVELRQYIVENFNLKYIIDIPEKSFENTGTKTSCIIFSNDGETEEVQFIDFLTKKITLKIGVKEMSKKNYSMMAKSYEKNDWSGLKEGFKVVKLGDVIKIEAGKRILKKDMIEGDIPVYGGGGITAYCDQYNRKGVNCKISRDGISEKNCVQVISGKFYLNSSGFTIKTKKGNNKNYLWFLLMQNKQKVYNLSRGTAQQNLDMTAFSELEIPLPPYEKQLEFVEEVDPHYSLWQEMKKIIELQEKGLTTYTRMLYRENKFELMKLKDICEFLPKSDRKAGEALDEGKYRFYTCSTKKTLYLDEADYDEETIIIGTGGTALINIDSKFSCSADNILIKSNKDDISNHYIFYVIKSNMQILENGFNGSTIKHITKSYIQDLEIPIVSLELQKELNKQYKNLKKSYEVMKYHEKIAKKMLEKLKF